VILIIRFIGCKFQKPLLKCQKLYKVINVKTMGKIKLNSSQIIDKYRD